MAELPRRFPGTYTLSGFTENTSDISFSKISEVERYCRHFFSIIPFNETSHITCPQSDCVSEDLFDIPLCSFGAVHFSMLTCVDCPSYHEYQF